MSPRRSALTGAAFIFVAVAAPVSAAQAAAAPSSSSSTIRGLLDPITNVVTTLSGTLNTLLGASQVTTLQGVTSALNGGAAPSATTLAPVTNWLTTVSANPALPAGLLTSATQAALILTNAAGASGAPLSPASVATVTSVLGQIAGTSGLNTTGASALTNLASALTTSALAAAQTPTGGTVPTPTVPALPALPAVPALPLPISNPLPGGGTSGGTLPIGGGLLAPLQGVVTTLTALSPGGTAPTGSQLAPVTALLRQLAALPGIDGVAGAALTQLADQIDAQGAGLPTGLLTTLTSTLESVAATPGVPEPVTTVVKSITTLLGASTGTPTPGPTKTPVPAPGPTKTPVPAPGGTKTPTPTPIGGSTGGGAGTSKAQIGRVRISSARVDRKRGTIRITLSCPATGPACKTLLGVTRGGTLQSSTGVLSIKAGRSLTQTLKLRASSRRIVRKKTTTFVVGALLPNGSYAAKTVTAKAPKAKAKRH
jgi:hypothetical protein